MFHDTPVCWHAWAEVLDFGYPQNCALEVLQAYINFGNLKVCPLLQWAPVQMYRCPCSQMFILVVAASPVWAGNRGRRRGGENDVIHHGHVGLVRAQQRPQLAFLWRHWLPLRYVACTGVPSCVCPGAVRASCTRRTRYTLTSSSA
jgi:hypothetical protein